jgi:hypothetical protein
MIAHRLVVKCGCALSLAVSVCAHFPAQVGAQQLAGLATNAPVVVTNWQDPSPYPSTNNDVVDYDSWNSVSPGYPVVQAAPADEYWIAPSDGAQPPGAADVIVGPPGWNESIVGDSCQPEPWFWQALPDGLIYHSYWAGVHEPRLGILAMDERGSQAYWDGTLGGRVGLLRYGDSRRIFPQGWQLDVEAAAIIRMTLDEIRDFEYADYRVGVPITYGIDNWQFKFAGYHLSSHLGDELAIANPGSLANRINYVRDALVLGASVYPIPVMRLYSEVAYAFNVDGGAEPWEFQFGTELSQPGPTGLRGTPFFAINAHLREEHDFGGDINTEAGWLWRGQTGQVVRAGVQYFNGKSSQYQIFDVSEQQIGFGLWYDF